MESEFVSNVLDEEEESNVFSEESGDFSFDTGEEDSDSESDTGIIVFESEPDQEVSDWTNVPHREAHPSFAFLGVSGVNVDFSDETSVLECFQKFMDEDMWQMFSEQRNVYAIQFFAAHNNLKP